MRFNHVAFFVIAVFVGQVLNVPLRHAAPAGKGDRLTRQNETDRLQEIRDLLRSKRNEIRRLVQQLTDGIEGVEERSFASQTADMVGIAVDTVYIMTTTLLYGASILRGIKWLFLMVHFIG